MVFLLAGCGTFFGGAGDLGDAAVYDLDGLFDTKIVLEKGDAFALDMDYPGQEGYAFEGAVFDPAYVRLDKYFEVKDEENPGEIDRVQYLFTALQAGSTDISVKVCKPSDSSYPVEVFKSVHLVIEED
ncbi:hypothetical protein [Salidesulfovibrio onnuriiensis]|uniref:hypothetical protein n=1 Tax=Salidesulfovibrio onnuriiensis TaxID=2583823 RepID=UPI0011CC8C14|nr:hypothetical protein [Salidesulfovibrio onnuriiensis]